MNMLNKEINFDRFVRGLIFIALLVGSYLLLRHLSSVLIPFFVAWIVAYLLFPIVSFFQNKCRLRNRLLSIIVTIVLVCAAVGGLAYLAVPVFIEQLDHLKDVALRYIENGASNATIPETVQDFFTKQAGEFSIDQLLREHDVQKAIQNIIGKIWSVAWTTVGVLVSIISSLIAIIYLFFLLLDYEKFADGWMEFVPRKNRSFVGKLVDDVTTGMSRYFRGQALVALSNCVMFSIGFWLIGFPIPVGLGLFIGIISFVPYLQLLGFVPAVVLALLKAAETDANFWMLIGGVVLVYCVVQVLQDTIFTPRIMGKYMGLNPAIILLSLSIWGYLLGIIGLIIALPVTTLIISYYKRYVIGEENADEAHGNPTITEAGKN